MPKSKPNERTAREDFITNIPLIYEPYAGEDNAPFSLPEDNEEERPFPTMNPFHYNDNLIESSEDTERTARLARRLVGWR
jgi:hypothetical protein